MNLTFRSLVLGALLVVPVAFAEAATETVTTGYSFGVVSVSGGFGLGGLGGTCTGGAFVCLATLVVNTINYILVPVLFAIAFIVFLYGVAKAYIFSRGEPDKVSEGHKLILWGLIGFAVMVSVWGLVNIVASTFGLTGGAALPPPVSPYQVGNVN